MNLVAHFSSSPLLPAMFVFCPVCFYFGCCKVSFVLIIARAACFCKMLVKKSVSIGPAPEEITLNITIDLSSFFFEVKKTYIFGVNYKQYLRDFNATLFTSPVSNNSKISRL